MTEQASQREAIVRIDASSSSGQRTTAARFPEEADKAIANALRTAR